MRYVVAGLHAAGRSACAWLRKADPTAEIIGVDPAGGPLYSRPLISYVLSGEMPLEGMTVAGEDYWSRLGVTLVRERAVSLDAGRARLVLDSGRELPYDRLLLACGARPRKAQTGGEKAGELCYFRGKADLARILERVRPGGAAAVLGGGLVGFKLTMGLIKRGMSVTLLVTSPHPLSLNVDERAGAWVGEKLANAPNVTLKTSVSVTRLDDAGNGRLRLALDDGETLDVDLAAAGKGVVPETGWLADSGLALRYGVVTDGFLRSSDERVFAAGDLAEAPDAVSGAPGVNAVWPVAVEQGRVAACNMAGVRTPYAGSMAMNAIPVFGTHMVSVGAVNPRLTVGCDFEEIGDPGGKYGYLKLVFREGRLIGAAGLGAAPRLGELAFAVKRGLGRKQVPDWWFRNPKNAAPLAAPYGFIPRLAAR